MSAHRAFPRNIRRDGTHINTGDCVAIRALIDSLLDNRSQPCPPGRPPTGFSTYPQLSTGACAQRVVRKLSDETFRGGAPSLAFSGLENSKTWHWNPGFALSGCDALVEFQESGGGCVPGEPLAEGHRSV